jgi:hypothetical protein
VDQPADVVVKDLAVVGSRQHLKKLSLPITQFGCRKTMHFVSSGPQLGDARVIYVSCLEVLGSIDFDHGWAFAWDANQKVDPSKIRRFTD